MADDASRGSLAGVKVLEFTQMVAGPLAGTMLADLGASVIKLEGLKGDPLRFVRPQYKGMCAHFFAVNRQKRSIALDLKTEEGRDVARRLATECDVVVVNARPAAMTRLGLDYEQLKAINPNIIYVMITGFGLDGPYVDRPAYDQVIQSLTGAMTLQSPEGPPAPLRSMFVDKYAATVAVSAVNAALFHRERHGEGQFISVPLMKSFAFFSLVDNLHNQCFVEGEDRTPIINITRPFRASDGTFMGHVQTDEQLRQISHAFGLEDLTQDERFNSAVKRVQNYQALWQELEKGSIHLTSAEVEEMATRYGLPIGKVKTVDEFLEDPQAIHLGCVKRYDTEEYGPVRAAAHPVDFSKTPADTDGVAPRTGEHTVSILQELGFDDERVAALRQAGAIQ
ncbi:CaiB/BaiF CoA transferase family protein [Sphingomonas panacis]|nr:CoA transferase [Sphingomonas panacis]